VRFVNGQIVGGSSGPVAGRLDEVLARCGLVSRSDLRDALEQAALEERRLGPVLVERGLVSRQQLDEVLRLQVRDALFAAFFWGSGSWRFEPDEGSGPLEEITFRLSTPALIVELVASIDSPEVVSHALGDRDRPLEVVDDPPSGLGGTSLCPADAYILSRVDGILTAQEIIEISPLPRPEVERAILRLVCAGLVEFHPRPVRKRRSPDETVALPASTIRAAFARRNDNQVEGMSLEQTLASLAGKSHTDVLGVAAEASEGEVKAAYQRMVKRLHPDVVAQTRPELRDAAKAIFMRVAEAYAALRLPVSRATPEPRPLPEEVVSPEAPRGAAARAGRGAARGRGAPGRGATV